VSFGAAATISNSQIIDNISVNTGFDATSILVLASGNVRIAGNAAGNNQFGITLASSLSGSADNNVVPTTVSLKLVRATGWRFPTITML